MSRARHRLARRQDSVVNKPTQSTERTFTALIDNDTFTRSIRFDLDDTAFFNGVADGHTGGTSDSFHAAWYHSQFRGARVERVPNKIEDAHYLLAGAIMFASAGDFDNGFITTHIAQGQPNQGRPFWPWSMQVGSGPGGAIDKFTAPENSAAMDTFACRTYLICDLSKKGPEKDGRVISPTAGDTISSAVLRLTRVGREIGGLPHSQGSPYNLVSGALDGDKDYCVYRVLQGLSTGNFDDINWYGISGGTNDVDTWWGSGGGGAIGTDITNTGKTCITLPGVGGLGGGGGGDGDGDGDGDGGPNPGEGEGGRGGDPNPGGGDGDGDGGVIEAGTNLTVEWDVTQIVQDAIDSDNGLLKLALYGEEDTDVTTVNFQTVFDGQLTYKVSIYPKANNMQKFHSVEASVVDDFKPHLEISFIDRT